MEFKIGELAQLFNGELLRTEADGSLRIQIDGKERSVKLLRSGTNEIEFILDRTFHHVKFQTVSSAESKLLVDGQPVVVKRHSKLTEILEKASLLSGTGTSDRSLASQIPGRVVSVATKVGGEVKKGDVVVVLESMKMQVAVKAHKDGVIKELRVKQGMSVMRNDVLALIE